MSQFLMQFNIHKENQKKSYDNDTKNSDKNFFYVESQGSAEGLCLCNTEL